MRVLCFDLFLTHGLALPGSCDRSLSNSLKGVGTSGVL